MYSYMYMYISRQRCTVYVELLQCVLHSDSCHQMVRFASGEMTVYVGGQQPGQTTDVGSNVLMSTFMVHI